MSPMPLMLIPCKSLAFGKSRLSPLLTVGEREALCRDLLISTLNLAVDVAGTANVRLVSADLAAGQIAKGAGVETYAKDWPDLNTALSGIREELAAAVHWNKVIILPIDLPLATKAAIQTMAAERADVTIVPDRKELGTNALAINGQMLREFPFAYGEGSFATHWRIAAERGWSVSVRRIPELAFDIDEPEDYLEWKKLQAASRHAAAGGR
jgi:2-phospho-L-lactate guanylyltransferase